MDRDHTFTNVFKKLNHDQSLSELQHPGKRQGDRETKLTGPKVKISFNLLASTSKKPSTSQNANFNQYAHNITRRSSESCVLTLLWHCSSILRDSVVEYFRVII